MAKAFEFYPTPGWATHVLLDRFLTGAQFVEEEYDPRRRIAFEPCAGDEAMATPMRGLFPKVITNDIDPQRTTATWNMDAALPDTWTDLGPFGYIITNPPFSQAQDIVSLAYQRCSCVLACLLRLSFLEPTQKRGDWLKRYPPTNIIVLPRISFTGDGKTDSVTCAWMVWDKVGLLKHTPPIDIVTKDVIYSMPFEWKEVEGLVVNPLLKEAV